MDFRFSAPTFCLAWRIFQSTVISYCNYATGTATTADFEYNSAMDDKVAMAFSLSEYDKSVRLNETDELD
jgi:hypothetical protein